MSLRLQPEINEEDDHDEEEHIYEVPGHPCPSGKKTNMSLIKLK